MSVGSMELIQQITVVKTISGNLRSYPFLERTDTLSYKSQDNGELELISGVEQEIVASILYLNSTDVFQLALSLNGEYMETSQFCYRGDSRSFFLLNLVSIPVIVEYFAFVLDE